MILASAVGAAVLLYALVLIIDPYDSVSFSPDWDRYPLRGDHRHWNARLVKQPAFDSLVVGTSTAMLLKPESLNQTLGGRFANLSMPLATPYEQMRMIDLFAYFHPDMRTVIIDLDFLWCNAREMPIHANERLRLGYPDYLYDTNPLNDWPPFNKTTVKAAWDQGRALWGSFRPYQRWLDGYEDNSTTLHAVNDAAAIRKRIHETVPETLLSRGPSLEGLEYPSLEQLDSVLERLPDDVLKVLYFPPIHVMHQAQAGSRQEVLWNACKARAGALTESVRNLIVVDFMTPSSITRDDTHYIDGLHYNTEVADRVVRLLGDAVRAPFIQAETYRVGGSSLK